MMMPLFPVPKKERTPRLGRETGAGDFDFSRKTTWTHSQSHLGGSDRLPSVVPRLVYLLSLLHHLQGLIHNLVRLLPQHLHLQGRPGEQARQGGGRCLATWALICDSIILNMIYNPEIYWCDCFHFLLTLIKNDISSQSQGFWRHKKKHYTKMFLPLE